MSVIVETEELFQAMLIVQPDFLGALPPGSDPNDHVIWMSTFEDEIEEDVFRPLALCLNAPFGASRTTEGNLDLPLYTSGIYVELQRNHSDFNTDNPHVSRKAFKQWYGSILDDMSNWRKFTNMRFLRFESVVIAYDACRTEQAKRDTEDDFWAVGLQFQVDSGVGGE